MADRRDRAVGGSGVFRAGEERWVRAKGHGTCYTFHIINKYHIFTLVASALLLLGIGSAQAQSVTVTLAWDPDISPSVAGYRLYTGTTSGVYTQTSEVGTATATSVSNLITGQTYYFAVTAYNNTGVESRPSNEVSVVAGSAPPSPTPTPTPSAAPTAPPLAPTNLSATTLTAGRIQLTWTDNANNEAGFKIERSIDGTTFSQIGTVGMNTTIFTSGGLNASTKYYYRVRAYNSAGDSNYSNTANATTLAAGATPTPTPTATPTPTPTPTAGNPIISPGGGKFKKKVTIKLSSATAGAKIYYTLDGSDPTTSSAVYSAASGKKKKSKGIKMTGIGPHIVKAKAVATGYIDSGIASATLTIY